MQRRQMRASAHESRDLPAPTRVRPQLWRSGSLFLLCLFLLLSLGNYGCGSECRFDIDCAGTNLCQGGRCVGNTQEKPPPPPVDGGGPQTGCIEGESRACYAGAPTTRGIGSCKDGRQSCSGGVWTLCTGDVKPAPEVCDGIDNDCNGTVDDGAFGGEPCLIPGKKGPCERGVKKCVGGTLSCTQTTQPAAKEECGNGVDDNCNGQIDEPPDCACGKGTSQACYSVAAGQRNKGECKDGTQTCGTEQKWSECIGEKLPAQEACDGKDNDCNGLVDDGLERVCGESQGTCVQGKQKCENGQWGTTCAGAIAPVQETCDGKDNDCDGATDEDLTKNCTTPCGSGTQKCQGGQWQGCEAPNVGTETCDNRDNDCDGQIDERLTQPCNNGCGAGIETCDRGKWINCTAPKSAPEICDGKDNDCDGNTDETRGPATRLTQNLTTSYYGLAAVWDGKAYGVMYRVDKTVYLQRVDTSGKFLGKAIALDIAGPGSPFSLQLIWTGKEYAAFWRYYSSSKYTYKLARLSQTGQKLSLRTYQSINSGYARIAWNGLNFGIAWSERITTPKTGYVTRFQRLKPDGTELGTPINISDTHSSFVSSVQIAAASTVFGVTWSQSRISGNSEIYFQKVDKDAKKIGTLINVSNATGSSLSPVIAANKSYFLVAWRDTTSGKSEIHGARLFSSSTATVSKRVISSTIKSASNFNIVTLNKSSFFGEFALLWTEYDSAAAKRYSLWYQKMTYSVTKRGAAFKVHEDTNSISTPAQAIVSTKLSAAFWINSSTGRTQVWFRGLCGF